MSELHVLVEGMHCPSCVAIIEGALKEQKAQIGRAQTSSILTVVQAIVAAR